MVAAVTEPTPERVDGVTAVGRSAMLGRVWQRLVVQMVMLAAMMSTLLAGFHGTRFAASLLGRDAEALGDTPFYVGLALGVVAGGAAGFAVQRRFDRRRQERQ